MGSCWNGLNYQKRTISSMPSSKPHIVVIGGGTGSFTLLNALKALTPNITALVSMADDGGSTGVLRDELGVLPPGDVRQCLVALARASEMRALFNYRFSEGTFSGHSFGNLFLTALEKVTGSFATAVETASHVLNIRGTVLPITLDNVRLVLHRSDGTSMNGERVIDVAHFTEAGMRPELSLKPSARINPKAAQAILNADVVVIAPGDLYTSLGPLLIVDGVASALRRTNAKIVYVCNLTVKPGQTTGFGVSDHASEIERFVGGSKILDYVLYNTAKPDSELLRYYAKHKADLVVADPSDFSDAHYIAVGRDLIAREVVKPQVGDALSAHRSLIRHDPKKLAHFVDQLLNGSFS